MNFDKGISEVKKTILEKLSLEGDKNAIAVKLKSISP